MRGEGETCSEPRNQRTVSNMCDGPLHTMDSRTGSRTLPEYTRTHAHTHTHTTVESDTGRQKQTQIQRPRQRHGEETDHEDRCESKEKQTQTTLYTRRLFRRTRPEMRCLFGTDACVCGHLRFA